jgi:hypothetical protein
MDSHAEGYQTVASGNYSHAEGWDTTASGHYSHAEGYDTKASGNWSHAEGYRTTALGEHAHAEGSSTNKLPDTITSESTDDEIITAWNTKNFTLAKGKYSHVEGNSTLAIGQSAHAEGSSTIASGTWSHAEGSDTIAFGLYSHAEGNNTIASSSASHAEGEGTHAYSPRQHVQGTYNIVPENYAPNVSHISDYIHIVGNGSSDTERSNAHTLDGYGNAWFAGDVYVGSTSGTNKDEGSVKLATEKYVDNKPGEIVTGKTFTINGESITAGTGAEVFNEYNYNIATGTYSHAEGYKTTASGSEAHAEGFGTIASGRYQHVQGKFNIEDIENKYAHIVGNGTASNMLSNAHTLDWEGNAWYAGTVETKAIILNSSTPGSTKKFKVTVDDSGTLTVVEL